MRCDRHLREPLKATPTTTRPRTLPTTARAAPVGRWALICAAAWLAVAGISLAKDSPRADSEKPGGGDLLRFLPNDGNSVYAARGLLRRWPAEGPELLWRAEVGWGKSAVVESGGRAFTAAETDDKQWAVCLDPERGTILWKHLLHPEKNRHFEWGPVTSPVLDGDRAYFIPYANHQGDVWEMRCPIVCLRHDGTELWRIDREVWATEGSTPLVVGPTLFVGADNPQRAVLAAVDKMTGKVRWTTLVPSERPRELGAPASLTYQEVGGIPQVIVATYGTREVLGVHAETGKIMWRYPYPADIIIGLISTPVAVGSRVFLSAGESKGRCFSACLEMRAEGDSIAARELYTSNELQTNLYNTVAIDRGTVFGFGGNERVGFLHATDFEDGRLLWRDDARQWANDRNLIVADGLIFAVTKDDHLVLAEASREQYCELGRVKVPAELGRPQQPTLANGRLYLRGSTEVVCYRIVP